MSPRTAAKPKRRTRVPGEPNRSIYSRKDATGVVIYEVGFRTASGSQSFRTIGPRIMEARAERDRIHGTRVKVANVRLTFGQAADKWLAKQVVNLAPRTQDYYRERLAHLLPYWERRRLDHIGPADAAAVVADLRAKGYAESTINGSVIVIGRVYKFARGKMGSHAVSPLADLDASDRARLSETPPRRIFSEDEIDQTIEAAREPWRTVFALVAVTGARQSEIAGLTWEDLDLADLDSASVAFDYQASRGGKRERLKTPESRRVIELPRFVAVKLAELKASSRFSKPGDFAFCTRTGKAISQRNLSRELRKAQTAAVDAKGRPTFPLLHVRDEDDKPVAPPRNSIPSWHSFRHSAASEAIAAGETVEEVSWRLGHKNSITTARIYTHQLKSAKRSAERRAKLEARYGSRAWQPMAAQDGRPEQTTADGSDAEVVNLQAERGRRQ